MQPTSASCVDARILGIFHSRSRCQSPLLKLAALSYSAIHNAMTKTCAAKKALANRLDVGDRRGISFQ